MTGGAAVQMTEHDRTLTSIMETVSGTGSLKYMASEVFRGAPACEKLDLYSLAIVWWELQSRSQLLFRRTKLLATGHRHAYTPKSWSFDAAAGVRPELPASWPKEVRALMAACWSAEPSRRPSAHEVMEAVKPLLRPEQHTHPEKGGVQPAAAGGGSTARGSSLGSSGSSAPAQDKRCCAVQ
jgi:serine/threonine protein kinase